MYFGEAKLKPCGLFQNTVDDIPLVIGLYNVMVGNGYFYNTHVEVVSSYNGNTDTDSN